MNRREALQRTAAITGLAVTGSAGLGFLNGCRPSGEPDWQPVFLTNEEVGTVTAITDTIIPKTDTPGAVDLHVPEFIDLMLHDCYAEVDQVRFRDGLKNFIEKVVSDHNKTFEKCSKSLQADIITSEEDISYDLIRDAGRKSFYLILKELTLLGYFSSEYVMTHLLNYTPVATRYEGCIPFVEGDKLYVDNNV